MHFLGKKYRFYWPAATLLTRLTRSRCRLSGGLYVQELSLFWELARRLSASGDVEILASLAELKMRRGVTLAGITRGREQQFWFAGIRFDLRYSWERPRQMERDYTPRGQGPRHLSSSQVETSADASPSRY